LIGVRAGRPAQPTHLSLKRQLTLSLYVIGEVWNGMRRHGHRELGLWLLSVGFFVGVLTDLVVAYGGG